MFASTMFPLDSPPRSKQTPVLLPVGSPRATNTEETQCGSLHDNKTKVFERQVKFQ